MNTSVFSRALVGICLLVVPGATVACSSSDTGAEKQATGTLSLPLVTNVAGHTYRLSGQFYVSGPIFSFYDLGGDAPALSLSLPTGNYSAYLYSWSLNRLDENGVYVPVRATLTSNYWVNFSIFNQASTSISFQFQTNSETVTVGTGNLSVNFGVTELPPACAPLGDDCFAGSWCPPSQLTGAPLACVGAGGVGLGESCASPTECVANSTCVDEGSGPHCTALCLAADFGAACANGGTCTEVGSEYGVCRTQPTPPGDTGEGGAPGDSSGGAGGSGGG
ncbi:MAG: hypothetical protein QM756_21380 [Polyangiaceae bacterium]